nr:MAG TPA: hypothetical protein [Caudoviricetes sp.]
MNPALNIRKVHKQHHIRSSDHHRIIHHEK